MTFQPVLPMGGLSGWSFLNATLDKQTKAFDADAVLTRDTAYFAAKIGEIGSAEDLVADRRLLRVALGAFGLQDDLDSRFLIRKILEEGTDAPDALANRLADDRYKELAKTFGFGDLGGARTKDPGFARRINDDFRRQQFEVAVGEQDQSLRLAMNAQRALPEIAQMRGSENVKWLKIMGTPPLRQVFETALGLPSSFVQLDLDRQLEVFQDRAKSQLGIDSLADLDDEALQEKVIERFMLRDQIASFNSASGTSIALTLLQSAPRLF